MIPHARSVVAKPPGSWLIAGLLAIASLGAGAAEVRDYRPVFQECRQGDGPPRLAIRRMEIAGVRTLLTVDPETLATRLERETELSCEDTDDERQKDTRYIKAVRASAALPAAGQAGSSDVVVNGGLVRGAGTGSFITGDLCPSLRPLDRAFLDGLPANGSGPAGESGPAGGSATPVALSISGLWLVHHHADFEWLRDRERAGRLRIAWVDHSYHHPYVRGRAVADNFLLMPGVDIRSEILDTERLLIAGGETPSVFFRFPGLISNPPLMQAVGDHHLIVLGADAWLARSPRARPGAIILVHPNGNEPAGLELFSSLLAAGKLPQPFRPIDEAP